MLSLADLLGYAPLSDESLPDGPPWSERRRVANSYLSALPFSRSNALWPRGAPDPWQEFANPTVFNPSPHGYAPDPTAQPMNLAQNLPSGGLLGNHPIVHGKSGASGAPGGILQHLTYPDGYTSANLDSIIQGASGQSAAPTNGGWPVASEPIAPNVVTSSSRLQRNDSVSRFTPTGITSGNRDTLNSATAGSWLPFTEGRSGLPYAGNDLLGSVATRGSANNAEIASDADPDPWVPNAQYANLRPRRGTMGPRGRELTPGEEIRLMIYNHHRRTLRELDPTNRSLQTLSSPEWIPSEADNNFLRREIARVQRRQRGLSDLEPHHKLPREFEDEIRACGLDPEDFTTYIPRDVHRLRPDGIHTGPENWNSVWRRYFEGRPEGKPDLEHVLRQLLEMWKDAPWLKR